MENTMEDYDYIVTPGSEPKQIGFRFNGTTGLGIEPNGDLLIATLSGSLIERAPFSYQVKGDTMITVDSAFRIKDGVVSFDLGVYDPELE